jgi:DNA repair exonuclease SbcCD ATPase subunit
MSEPVFFEWLEVEGFRGFAERQRLDLGASVVILSGPNGTGKTSFFDAIQWLLLGTLERLEPWRLRRNAEHVVNQYRAAGGGLATVTASIRLAETTVELRRSGRYDDSQLEWRANGETLYEDDARRALADALTPEGRMTLQRSLLSSGLLQQDVIRDVLEDKPAQRYDQLSAMLGLNTIAGFPAAAKRRADRLATEGDRARQAVSSLESSARSLSDRIGSLRAQAAQAPDTQAVRAQLMQRLERHAGVLALRGELPLSSSDALELRMATGLAADELTGLIASDDRAAAELAEQEPPPADELAKLNGVAEAAAVELATAHEAAAAAHRAVEDERAAASTIARLAADALPLLGDQCPVCGQAIDPEHVRGHLEAAVAAGSRDLDARIAHEAETTAQISVREREATESAEAAARAKRRADQIAAARSNREAWNARLADIVADLTRRFDVPGEQALRFGDREAMRAIQEALTDVSVAAATLASAFGGVRESVQISAAEAQLAEVRAQIEQARELAARASASEEEGRMLQRAAVRAAAAVTESRFAVLAPAIQDVYSRLDPHPAFTNLEFAVEVYRERGIASPRAIDPEHDLPVDPLLVFSTSQANVVALSAFLALGWAAGEDAMPFLLLDDPLQSLDDVNALGFSDLCRHMRTRRQLIVSTHDARLASLLERKLAPRRADERTRMLRFVAWSRSGPLIDDRDIDPQVDQGRRRALLPASR